MTKRKLKKLISIFTSNKFGNQKKVENWIMSILLAKDGLFWLKPFFDFLFADDRGDVIVKDKIILLTFLIKASLLNSLYFQFSN